MALVNSSLSSAWPRATVAPVIQRASSVKPFMSVSNVTVVECPDVSTDRGGDICIGHASSMPRRGAICPQHLPVRSGTQCVRESEAADS